MGAPKHTPLSKNSMDAVLYTVTEFLGRESRRGLFILDKSTWSLSARIRASMIIQGAWRLWQYRAWKRRVRSDVRTITHSCRRVETTSCPHRSRVGSHMACFFDMEDSHSGSLLFGCQMCIYSELSRRCPWSLREIEEDGWFRYAVVVPVLTEQSAWDRSSDISWRLS